MVELLKVALFCATLEGYFINERTPFAYSILEDELMILLQQSFSRKLRQSGGRPAWAMVLLEALKAYKNVFQGRLIVQVPK